MNEEFAKKTLLKALEEYDPSFSLRKVPRIRSAIKTAEFNSVSRSLLLVRDMLICNGKVIEEHLEEGYYIASLDFLNMNSALTFIGIENENVFVAAYAKEGIIKQDIAKKTIEALRMLIEYNHLYTFNMNAGAK